VSRLEGVDGVRLFCISNDYPERAEKVDSFEGERVTRSDYEQWIAALDSAAIRGWLWSSTKSASAAEAKELVQEVKTRLLEADETKIRDSQDGSGLRNFAIGVAAHVGVDWLRRHGPASGLHFDADVTELRDDRESPEHKAIADQELQLLLRAIKRLPVQQRRVVTLLKVYGYTVQETAQRLAIEESSVKAHLRRATLECAKQLLRQRVPPSTRLLARLFKLIGLGRRRRSGHCKLIEPTE
jgi:RNA polymerase sigma factor (sigma-70 family)